MVAPDRLRRKGGTLQDQTLVCSQTLRVPRHYAYEWTLVRARGYGMPPFGAEMIVDVEEVKPGEEPAFDDPKEG